jgi:two-component system cell cycle response regulator DivK
VSRDYRLWRIDCYLGLAAMHSSLLPPAPEPLPRPATREFHEAPTLRKKVATWDGDPPRILVVEDSLAQRVVYEESLESLGYDVVTASSGEEAIRVATETHPRVVIMDVSLGAMDGIEAMRLLKAHTETCGAAVIIATCHGDDAFASARGAGCDAFLCKPVNPFTLDEVIRALLTSAAGQPSLRNVSGFDCARALTLVGFEITAAEAPSVTLVRDGVTLYVPLSTRLSAEVLETLLHAADLPAERFAELLQRFA